MRIAQVAPLDRSVPPKLYGGTERVVSLADRGAGRARPRRDAVRQRRLAYPRASSRRSGRARCGSTARSRDPMAPHIAMLETVRRRAARIRRRCISTSTTALLAVQRASRRRSSPRCTGGSTCRSIRPLSARFRDVPAVSISDTQRQPLPQANWVTHDPSRPAGKPADAASRRSRSYLAFLGRISPEKRVDRAIAIAGSGRAAAQDRRQGRPRRPGLFRARQIKPLLDAAARRVHRRDRRHGRSRRSSAARRRCSFPIDWPEPFGLVMIEAMACGTPVIAFNRGSVPEVIEDGVTGFIVEDEARPSARSDRARAAVARRGARSASSSASPRAAWREEDVSLYTALAGGTPKQVTRGSPKAHRQSK